jgi:hypothetical protein
MHEAEQVWLRLLFWLHTLPYLFVRNLHFTSVTLEFSFELPVVLLWGFV